MDFLSQLSSVDLGLFSSLSLLPSISIGASAVLRLALAEADSDVALKPDVVAGGELERIEHAGQHASLPVIVPLTKDGWISSTTILISHQVGVTLIIIIHGVSYTAPGKPSIYCIRLYINLEHEVVSNLSSGDVLSIRIADSHGTCWRRTSVGDGASCGQHGHVEANIDLLNARVVDTSDSVGLRLVGHKLGMFLDHQHKVCFALK